MHKNNQIQ